MQIVRQQGAVTSESVEHLLDLVPFPRRVLYASGKRMDETEQALQASAYAGSRIPLHSIEADDMVVCVELDEMLSNPRAVAIMVFV